jgi:NTP pyrophosphatase (non-canonical NTP hydrolase)
MTTDCSAEIPQTKLVDVDALARTLEEFAIDRDWLRFHSPKNLVMALTGEVGELSELFQWMPEDASRNAASDPRLAEPLRDELADVLLYLVRLASVLGVDLDDAARKKLAKNAAKYPIAAAYGSSRKYTEL